MTTQNFIDELQEVSAQFTWTLEPDTGIYASLRRWPRLHVRGVSKVGPEAGIVFEPMGALCYARTGQILEPKAWDQAGDSLGLLPAHAADIHAAADDRTWAGEEGKREPVEYLQVLRARLLVAVGLSLPTPASLRKQTSDAPSR